MNKFCIIISLTGPWDNHPRKYFYIAIAETIRNSGGYILCLEPTILSIHTLLVYPERIIDWLKGKHKFRKVGDNIYAVAANTVEHILASIRLNFLMFLNKKLLKRQLSKSLCKIDNNIRDVILMLHRPELYFMIGLLGEKGVIYDCCDEYNLTSQMNNLKVIGNEKREKILAEKCNFIIASADLLYKRNLGYNQNTFLVENGYSKKLYEQQSNDAPAFDVAKLKKPIIGYIGKIRLWLNYNLLDFLMSERPDWSFLFAGDIRKDSRNEFDRMLKKHRNLYSTGWVDYKCFPQYLRHFDVGIIPFNTNPYMESANPNKLYDYMASGVPVVATDIGDLKNKYSDFVKVADTKEEFLAHLDSFVNMPEEQKPNLRNRILKMSEGHSWEDNAENLLKLTKQYILH